MVFAPKSVIQWDSTEIAITLGTKKIIYLKLVWKLVNMSAHLNQQFVNLPNQVRESSFNVNVRGGGKELEVHLIVQVGSESGDVGGSDTVVSLSGAHNYN